MQIPIPPSGFNTFRKNPPGSGGGTLGTAMQKGSRLKKVKEGMELDKWRFQEGAPKELKLFMCPGCAKESCYHIGGGPNDIECLNRDCRFFKEPLKDGEKRIRYSSDKPYEESNDENNINDDDDEDTKEIDLDFHVDWGMGPF